MKFRYLVIVFLSALAAKSQTNSQDDGRRIRIPVIVHLIYTDSSKDNGITMHSRLNGNISQYLPDEKIKAEIHALNLDFQKQNPDTIAVISEYEKIIGNPHVSFYLKEIKRVKADSAVIEKLTDGSNFDAMKSLSPIVNSDENLNVYIGKIIYKNKTTNGVTPVPKKLGDNKGFDVVKLNYKWIGLDYHLLTHEAGHWLGLHHTFDTINTLSKEGITDIPQQKISTHMGCEHCPPKVKDNIKANTGFKHSNYNNFMDYSGCRSMFSMKQAEKIRTVIIKFRPKLYSNSTL